MFESTPAIQYQPEEPIFPLVSFNPDTQIWKCVGTGFFIHHGGGFLTAKHVFYDNEGNYLPTLYGIQTYKNERHIRPIINFVVHPKADIAIGYLGKRRIPGGDDIKASPSPYFVLDLDPLSKGETINSFAFPLTERSALEEGGFEFLFHGQWHTGSIVDYLPDGSPLLKNRCYHTSMFIDHGASGGPVLKDSMVIGINSSGMNVIEGEEPISFITPIDYILDLEVKEGNKYISVKELIDEGYIETKSNLKK